MRSLQNSIINIRYRIPTLSRKRGELLCPNSRNEKWDYYLTTCRMDTSEGWELIYLGLCEIHLL